MPNKYLKSKIFKYEILTSLVATLLILSAFIAGRFFYFKNWLILIVGLILGVVGGLLVFILEYFSKKAALYQKGLALEERVSKNLHQLPLKCEAHVETQYGDLDFFVEKNNKFYGLEVKDWPGAVVYENGLLKINGWDNTYVLSSLLNHCRMVKEIKFGDDPKKFINPVLVFGYKTSVNIPQKTITFNNVEIAVTTIRDFEQYF